MQGNNQYKDSVFTLLFQDKEKLIELYNAIEGTSYTKDTKIEINTLEKALYMDRKNDISFLLDGKFIVLVEHQSSINKNMPLRFLMYIARVYEKLLDADNIYKESRISIPAPEFIVLYNGKKNFPKQEIMNLSEAFKEKNQTINLELNVRVININYEKESEVLERSKTLRDYSYFIYLVKQYIEQGIYLEDAIQKAIQDCMKQNRLKQFLKEHGSEVINMLFTEFDLDKAKEVWREEGREEGERTTKLKIAVSLLGILDLETISTKTGLSIDELEELKEKGNTE